MTPSLIFSTGWGVFKSLLHKFILLFITLFITKFHLPVCTINLHESERSKASAWIPFAWMPIYVEALAPNRPSQGFNSHAARRVSLEHQGLALVFKDWDARTRDAVALHWGGAVIRKSKYYLAAVVVDHPQLDKFAAGGKVRCINLKCVVT